MKYINIFLTIPSLEDFGTFEHGATTVRFYDYSVKKPKPVLEGVDWFFLDWVLEDLSGLELCRRIRSSPQTCNSRITIVLPENNQSMRARVLEAGADDYIIGPISRRAIIDRVLLSDVTKETSYNARVINYGVLMIDLYAYRAFWAGRPINLSPNDLKLLRYFADNANLALSRRDLIEGVGKIDRDLDERTVDVWVKRLRKAIKQAGGQNPIRTIRSVGYVLEI